MRASRRRCSVTGARAPEPVDAQREGEGSKEGLVVRKVPPPTLRATPPLNGTRHDEARPPAREQSSRPVG